MRALHTQADLRAALHCLIESDLPPHHKSVLIDAVAQTFREREAAQTLDEPLEEQKQWRQDEIDQLHALLDGRIARCWQDADELLTRSARQLGRSPEEVREQADMLGLGAAVDYRRARMIASER